MLPRLDGFALCRRLREDPSYMHLPVLLHSFRVEGPKYEAFAAEVGAQRFFPRGSTLEELAATLDEAPTGLRHDAHAGAGARAARPPRAGSPPARRPREAAARSRGDEPAADRGRTRRARARRIRGPRPRRICRGGIRAHPRAADADPRTGDRAAPGRRGRVAGARRRRRIARRDRQDRGARSTAQRIADRAVAPAVGRQRRRARIRGAADADVDRRHRIEARARGHRFGGGAGRAGSRGPARQAAAANCCRAPSSPTTRRTSRCCTGNVRTAAKPGSNCSVSPPAMPAAPAGCSPRGTSAPNWRPTRASRNWPPRPMRWKRRPSRAASSTAKAACATATARCSRCSTRIANVSARSRCSRSSSDGEADATVRSVARTAAGALRQDVRWRRPDGQSIEVEVALAAVDESTGFRVLTARDVSAARRAAERNERDHVRVSRLLELAQRVARADRNRNPRPHAAAGAGADAQRAGLPVPARGRRDRARDRRAPRHRVRPSR